MRGCRRIVMQWHGIPGNWKSTFPNLEISIGGDKWFVWQNFGSARAPTRTSKELPIQVEIGKWSSWVVHAKWSPKDDGLIQIWKDGAMVFESKGPNVYADIGLQYTPYPKTGIYHPEWNTNTEEKRKKFEEETPQSLLKTIYVTGFRRGDGRHSFGDMRSKLAWTNASSVRSGIQAEGEDGDDATGEKMFAETHGVRISRRGPRTWSACRRCCHRRATKPPRHRPSDRSWSEGDRRAYANATRH